MPGERNVYKRAASTEKAFSDDRDLCANLALSRSDRANRALGQILEPSTECNYCTCVHDCHYVNGAAIPSTAFNLYRDEIVRSRGH